MKIVQIMLALLLGATISTKAQYLGGSGDGHDDGFYSGLPDGMDITMLYKGGDGDGSTQAVFNGLTDGSTFSVLYNGASGDGFSQGYFNGLPDGSLMTAMYSGGAGDGFGQAAVSLSVDGNSYAVLYAGGSGDGYSASVFNGSPDGAQWVLMFQGGGGDGSSAAFSVESPLPIQLIYFEAALQGSSVALSWATASEYNNDFFTIEKSRDTKKIEMVSRVAGQNSSSEVTRYYAEDPEPYNGISYYRIKQTDYGGGSVASPWQVISCQYTQKDMLLFPNPGNGQQIGIRVSGASSGKAVISMYSSSGELVRMEQVKSFPSSGEYTLRFTRPLTPGVYLISVRLKDGLFSKRVVVR